MSITRKIFQLHEAAAQVGIEERIILEWIQNEWILPVTISSHELDEEDVARAQLVHHLRSAFGVNDEAMPIVLHLLDQIHHLHRQARNF